MIYEIAYLFLFFFGGKYILNGFSNILSNSESILYTLIKLIFIPIEYIFLVFDVDFTTETFFKLIKYFGIGLFFIALVKFLYRLFEGEYEIVKLNKNIDKNNRIYAILSKFQSGTIFAVVGVWVMFMIPSIMLFVMKIDANAKMKYFYTYAGIILWFSLLVCKHAERDFIKIKNIYNSCLNEYSELLINNNGVKNERMRQLEATVEHLENQRILNAKVASRRAMVTAIVANAVGMYAGKKIGDAIVKHNEDFFSEKVIKDGKEVRDSKSDIYIENLNNELSKL